MYRLPCVLFALLSSLAAAAAAVVGSDVGAEADAEAATRTVVARYLAAFTARDFTTLRGFYGPTSVLRDPTFAQVMPGLREVEARGAEAILGYLGDAHTSTLDFRIDVESEIVVGALAVVEGRSHLRARGDGLGVPGATLDFDNRVVFVLRVAEGRVVEHTEYNDYAAVRAQYAAQGGTAASYAALFAGASGEPLPEPVVPAAVAPTAPVPEPVVPAMVPETQVPEPLAPEPSAPEPPAPEPVVPLPGAGAAFSLEQIRTVAVIPVLSDGVLDDELTHMLTGQLREKKARFELLSEREVVVHFAAPSEFSSAAELERLLAAARRAGAQAIVVGQASSYRVQSDFGNRLRLKIVEVNQGQVVWAGGGWGTGGVSREAAKKRSVVDVVRQIP